MCMRMSNNKYFVYILACFKDGDEYSRCYYVGQTNDLDIRMKEHQSYIDDGRTDKYMGRFDSFEFIWYREVSSREDAIHLEFYLKSLSPPEKEKYMQKFGVRVDEEN